MPKSILSRQNLLVIPLVTAGTLGSLFSDRLFHQLRQTAIAQNTPVQLNQSELGLPANGIVAQYLTPPPDQPLAPFKVITSKKSEGLNYFIKLANWSNNQTILTLFVRGGQTASIDVPLGVYKVKIASGKKWYGINKVFGPQTDYGLIENRFGDSKTTFELKGDKVLGISLKLYDVINGNVRRKKISPKDF